MKKSCLIVLCPKGIALHLGSILHIHIPKFSYIGLTKLSTNVLRYCKLKLLLRYAESMLQPFQWVTAQCCSCRVVIYLFIHNIWTESQANPNSANALNLRDASKHLETDLWKEPSFQMQEGKLEVPGKPMEASLDWKPNAHKYWDRRSNPGLIGAKWREIRYANLLPQEYLRVPLQLI